MRPRVTLFSALAACLLALFAAASARADLVTPPVVDWVSIPSTGSVGQTISIGVGAHANYSDNSDGNDWNSGDRPKILIIQISIQRPGQSGWTTIYGWLDPWRTPAEVWASFTVNNPGTHYVQIQVMDGRPWFSDVFNYSIGVPSPAPSITSPLSVSLNQGQSVSYSITAANGPTGYSATNLPTGLSLNTTTGAISGTIPTNGGVAGGGGSVTSTITATNAVGSDTKTLVWTITAASIVTSASVSPLSIPLGSSVTLTRAGSANFGFAWTQGTIWKPDSSAEALGNQQLGSQSYTPTATGTYYYQFRLVDIYYNYLDQWISFTVSPAQPTTPGGLTATTTGSTFVTLSWSASTPPPGSSISRYDVYRGTTLVGSVTTGTTFTDNGVSPASPYTYSVVAVAGSGTSSTSANLTLTTAASLELFTPLN